jgi:hypothetical protein
MKIKPLILSTILPFSVFAMETNSSFELNLSNMDNYNFKQVEPGLVRHIDKEVTIEISYGYHGVKRHIHALEAQLNNLNKNKLKDYEYEYQHKKLVDEIATYTLNLEFLKKESSQKYGSVTSTNYTCNVPLTQTYTSYPMMWGAGLQVKSTYPMLPGPFPPTSHPVEIQAFSIFYPGTSYQRVDTDTYLGNNVQGGIATSFVGSGFTSSGAQIPFKAISTISDRWWQGLFGCYTKITVEGFIESSY